MSMGFDRSRETPLPKLGQPGGKPFRKAPGYWQEQRTHAARRDVLNQKLESAGAVRF